MPGQRSPDLAAAAWAAWVGGVVVVLALGALTDAIPPPNGRPGSFLWPLWSWDYDLYHYVSEHGYTDGRVDPTYAFFPLWPALLRAADALSDWVVPGIVTLAATYAAFRGVSELSPAGQRGRVAIALACWPGSFALALVYPDALALAAGAWACVLAARGRPAGAAVLAAVAAVARPPAFLLAIPLYALARGRTRPLVAAAPVAASAAVHAFFWIRSGSPAAFARAQSNWDRGTGSFGHWWDRLAERPLTGLAIAGLVLLAAAALRYRRGIWIAPYLLLVPLVLLAATSTATAAQVAQAAFVLPLCALLWTMGARYRVWATFATAVLALSLLSGSVQSFGRQALFAFPLFFAAAEGPAVLRSRPVIVLAIAANAALLLSVTDWAP